VVPVAIGTTHEAVFNESLSIKYPQTRSIVRIHLGHNWDTQFQTIENKTYNVKYI
jgi:hypothetical protein